MISNHSIRQCSCKQRVPDQHDSKFLKLDILIVEDSVDNQFLLSAYLRSTGASIDFADDGVSGVDKALQKSYDMIIMDIQLPKMDGLEAISRIRSHGIKTPILAHSAFSNWESRLHCREAGSDMFLPKPTDRKSLLDAISSCLKKTVATNIYATTDASKYDCAGSNLNSSMNPRKTTYALSKQRSIYKDDPIVGPLINQLVEKIPDRIAALSAALQSKNIKETSFLAHQLKGVLMSYGFVDEGQVLATIESDVKSYKTASPYFSAEKILSLLQQTFTAN